MCRIMSETGSISSSRCYYIWLIDDWSQLSNNEEYKSPDFYFDDLKWCLTLEKSILSTQQRDWYRIRLQANDFKPYKLVIKTIGWAIVFNDMRKGTRIRQYDFCPSKISSNGRNTFGTYQSIFLEDIRHLVSPSGQLSISLMIENMDAKVSKCNNIAPYKLYTEFVDSTKFSDISFRVFEHEEDGNTGNETETEVEDSNLIHAHKVVLANSSPWFDMLFTNGMQESSQNKITIYGVQFDVFKRLLTYCYIYESEMKDIEDAYKMMEAADRFQLAKVYKDALLFICETIDVETVWDIWKRADKYKYEKIINACIIYISERMTHVISSSAFLKAEAKYIRVVFDTEIVKLYAVDDTVEEKDLYEAILKWVENRKKEYDTETKKKLEDDLSVMLGSIRFNLIPAEYLHLHVQTNEFIMNIDGIPDKICKAYKYHASPKSRYIPGYIPRQPLPE